jgi:hypothetical protein
MIPDHADTLTMHLFSMGAFFPREKNGIQPHMMFSGPKSTGKSERVTQVMEMLIPGTSMVLGKQSGQSDSGLQQMNTLSNMVMVYEEAPAFIFNVNNSNGFSNHQPQVKPAETDAAATQFMGMMSSGEYSNKVLEFAEDGTRITKVYRCITNYTYLMCTNLNPYTQLSQPFFDRFHNMSCREEQYVSNSQRGIGSVSMSDHRIPSVIEGAAQLKDKVITMFRRNHYLLYWISVATKLELLETVDLSGVEPFMGAVYDAIDARMSALFKYNQSGESVLVAPRDKNRIILMVKRLVYIDAIHMTFDSEFSPFLTFDEHGRCTRVTQFDVCHILAIRPYLCARLEHAIFAMSLMSGVFDRMNSLDVILTMKTKMFKGVSIKWSWLQSNLQLRGDGVTFEPSSQLCDNKQVMVLFNVVKASNSRGLNQSRGHIDYDYLSYTSAVLPSDPSSVFMQSVAARDSVSGFSSYSPNSSNGNIRDHDSHDVIGMVCKLIADNNRSTGMKASSVRKCIDLMMNMDVPSLVPGTRIKAIKLDPSDPTVILIATYLILNATTDIFMSALTDVLSKITISRSRRILLGLTDTDTPYLFKHLDLVAHKARAKDAIPVRNALFVPSEVRYLVSGT